MQEKQNYTSLLVSLTAHVLANPPVNGVNVQGLGMLRIYLPGNVRLHIWHDDLKVPNATAIHTHPWNFESRVLNGALTNHIHYVARSFKGEPTHMERLLHCGVGGCLLPDQQPVKLSRQWKSPIYSTGSAYQMNFKQAHATVADNFTITVTRRHVPPEGNPDKAFVYTPIGEEFVSAEPVPCNVVDPKNALDAKVKAIFEEARFHFATTWGLPHPVRS